KIKLSNLTVVSIILLAYIIIINCIWFINVNYEISLLFNNLFYIFNISIMLLIIFISKNNINKLLVTLYYVIITSVFLQLLLYLFLGGNNIRETIFFNNPNQLAYYSLLCMAFLLVIKKRIFVKTIPYTLSI